ncbi:MAG: hypothetical protein ACXWAT_16895 [Methylobacter sp.]
MNISIIVAILTAVASIFVAALTFWLTKHKEREAEVRKQKLEHYRDLVSSFSGIVGTDSTPEGQKHFARASNNLSLIASQEVLIALQAFQHEIRKSNPEPSVERHDILLNKLMLAIRADLGLAKKDDIDKLSFRLWCSGAND